MNPPFLLIEATCNLVGNVGASTQIHIQPIGLRIDFGLANRM
jgi:hypothetical protein